MAESYNKILFPENYTIDNLKNNIIKKEYCTIDSEVPTCRLRGTLIDTAGINDGKLEVTGWQRNISKLKKMDVSLPTIIKIVVNQEDIIEDIELDNSFKGSKGLICSWKYLNNNMKEKLTGVKLDKAFLNKMRLDDLHCFHLTEVVGGIYSYYTSWKQKLGGGTSGEKYFEEEVIDCYADAKDLYFCGTHILSSGICIKYILKFNDIFSKVTFNTYGNVIMNGVVVDFSLNDQLELSQTISIADSSKNYSSLQLFLHKCISKVKEVMLYPKSNLMLNTNLFPTAFIGLFIQVVAVRTFRNNYNYIMHSLTALQRPNNIPVCLGGILDNSDAKKYFPKFSFNDLF